MSTEIAEITGRKKMKTIYPEIRSTYVDSTLSLTRFGEENLTDKCSNLLLIMIRDIHMFNLQRNK